MSTFAVVLPAAGRSTRFGDTGRRKPFVELAGRPVWIRALDPFLAREDVVQTIVCVSAENLDWFLAEYAEFVQRHAIDVVPGGAERFETVRLGLDRVGEDVEYVAVHDAARPLVAAELVARVFDAAVEHGAAIPGLPAAATLKRTKDGRIVETVDRTNVVLAQTPQVFRRELLVEAYERGAGEPATDDAQLVERHGHAVQVVSGSPFNFKVTTRDDLRMAEAVVHAARTD